MSAPASANAIAMPRPIALARAGHDRDLSVSLEAVEEVTDASSGAARPRQRQVEIGLDAGLGARHVRDRADAVDRRRDDAGVADEPRRDRLRLQPLNVSFAAGRR